MMQSGRGWVAGGKLVVDTMGWKMPKTGCNRYLKMAKVVAVKKWR